MTERLPPKISTFLFSFQLVIGIIGVGGLACCALFWLHQDGQRALLREASSLVAAAAGGLPVEDTVITKAAAERMQSALANHPGARYAVFAPDGRLLLSEPPGSFASLHPPALPAEFLAAATGGSAAAIRQDSDGERRLYAAAPSSSSGQPASFLYIDLPYESAMASTYQAMTATALLAAVLIALTALGNWYFGKTLAVPAEQLNQAARQLSIGDLSARAHLQGPREFQQLAHTLNTMAGSLQTNLEAMQSFVANASHELRTPLTSIKLQVGALRAGAAQEPEVAERFLAQVDCEIDRLVHTVNEMLDLSQIEGGTTAGAYQPVDLLDLACEVQALWEARAQHAGQSLSLAHEAPLPAVKGDPYRLRRLFDNLVDNAIKNTPTGGNVEIRLRRSTQSGWVRLEVCDTGTGIEAHHLRHIFDRFYRVNPTGSAVEARCTDPAGRRSSGSGLGLAIARSIVQAHNGQIGVESVLGSGSTFWVDLPAWSE